ncbi:DUF1641 domain-containing protein [Alkalihalobacillus sp. FSL W8-0930]
MAKATTTIKRRSISDEELREQELQEIQQLLVQHKDAISETFEIIQHMQDRRILPMLTALFSEGDKVLDILMRTIDNPETASSLKNMLLMAGVLGRLNVEQLEPLVLKINQGIARVADFEKNGEQPHALSLAKAIMDPEFRQALHVGVAFMKGLGEDQDHKERNTKRPKQQVSDEESEQSNRSNQSKNKTGSGSWKWAAAVAGFSIATLVFTATKK